MRDTKVNKKGFYKYISSKRKIRENMGLMLNVTRGAVTKDMQRYSMPSSPWSLLVRLAFRSPKSV